MTPSQAATCFVDKPSPLPFPPRKRKRKTKRKIKAAKEGQIKEEKDLMALRGWKAVVVATVVALTMALDVVSADPGGACAKAGYM